MDKKDFSTTIEVDETSDRVFAAVNNVRGWWSEDISGPTTQLNDEFVFRSGDYHISTQKITESVKNEKVVWSVHNSKINFVKDKNEWEGSKIIFDISKHGEKTVLRFTHAGLNSGLECYKACSNAWSGYVKHSLFNLITTGKGEPEQR